MDEPKSRRRYPRLVAFGLGFLIGVGASIGVSRGLRPQLRVGMFGGQEQVGGIVESKTVEADRVLLAIPAEQGAVLATFTDNAVEIGLLIEEGDSVVLGLDTYMPLSANPQVIRVVKARYLTGEERVSPDVPVDSTPPSRLDSTGVERADSVPTTSP